MICVVRRMCPDQAVRTVLEAYADSVPHAELARDFLEYRRWSGDEPLLFVAEAAAASTGQGFVDGIKPTVERFRDAFVATDRVDSLSALAALDREGRGPRRGAGRAAKARGPPRGRPSPRRSAGSGRSRGARGVGRDGRPLPLRRGLDRLDLRRRARDVSVPAPARRYRYAQTGSDGRTAARGRRRRSRGLADRHVDEPPDDRLLREWLAFVSDYGPSRSIGSRGGRPPSPRIARRFSRLPATNVLFTASSNGSRPFAVLFVESFSRGKITSHSRPANRRAVARAEPR